MQLRSGDGDGPLFLIFFQIAGEMAGRQRLAMVCSLVVAFATPLFVYSGWLYSDTVTAATVVTAALLLIRYSMGSWVAVCAGRGGCYWIFHSRAPANMVTVLIFIAASCPDREDDEKGYAYRTAAILVCVMAVSGRCICAHYVFFGKRVRLRGAATAEMAKISILHNPLWRGVLVFCSLPQSVFLFCLR